MLNFKFCDMKAKFIRAVENNDLSMVRAFISNEMLLDPRGKSFDEMLSFAESKFNNLYEIDNGVKFTSDQSQWNEDILFKIKNELDVNFSRERIRIYKLVAKTVLKEKAAQMDKEEAASKIKEESISNHSSYTEVKHNHNKKLYKQITAGGVLLTLAGTIVQKGVLTTLGIAGIVVGGVLIYKNNKK